MSSPDEARLDLIEEKIKNLRSDKLAQFNELQQKMNRKRELTADLDEIYKKLDLKKSAFDKNKAGMRKFSVMQKNSSSKGRDLLENIRLITKQLNSFEKELPVESDGALRQKLRDVEWKLETEKLSREQESVLVNEVRSIELALRQWGKAQAAKQEFDGLQASVKAQEIETAKISDLRESLGTRLDTERAEMEEMIELREQLRAANLAAINDIENVELRLDRAGQEIHTLSMNRKKILESLRADRVHKNRENEERLIKKARTSAREKLSKGSKLSIDELKLALHDDLGEA